MAEHVVSSACGEQENKRRWELKNSAVLNKEKKIPLAKRY
jgi:hypothetical protein